MATDAPTLIEREAERDRASATPVGPIDASKTPRFAGPASFARLPRLDQVPRADVAVVGVPFDSGVSYRPGARFGPTHVREASRLLRPYNPALEVSPFEIAQVADAGDIAVNPFNIHEAIETIEAAAVDLTRDGTSLVTIGGDHTIALPLLRAAAAKHGPVALVHFDAHLDTWDTYFGAEYTHGTPFRRAVEEGSSTPRPCRTSAPADPSTARRTSRTTVGSDSASSPRRMSTTRASSRSSTNCANASAIARCTCRSTSTYSTPHMRQAPGPRRRAG